MSFDINDDLKKEVKESRRARITRRFIVYYRKHGRKKTAYRAMAEIEHLAVETIRAIINGRR